MSDISQTVIDGGKEKMSALSGLIRASSIQEIVDIARPVLGNPLLITDSTHRILGISDEGDDFDPIWQKFNDLGEVPLSSSENSKQHRLLVESHKTKRPVTNHHNPDLPVLCQALSIADHIMGEICMPCYIKEPSDEDRDVLTFVASIASSLMEKALNGSLIPDDMLSFFICDLLEGRLTDKAQIDERLLHFNLRLNLPMLLVAVRPDFEDNANSRRKRSMYLESMAELFKDNFYGAPAFTYGQELRLFFPVTGNPGQDEDKVKKLFAFLKHHNMQAGASRPFFELTNLSAYHQQACKALELGTGFGDDAPLYNYDNYAVYHLLEYGSRQHNLMTFCHTAIFILGEYDRNHKTDFLETLHVYLNCHCNAAEAAAKLYIHRNTINYRLSKIHELTNIDLDNTESFFHIMLSYHILEYYSLTVAKDDAFKTKRHTYKTEYEEM